MEYFTYNGEPMNINGSLAAQNILVNPNDYNPVFYNIASSDGISGDGGLIYDQSGNGNDLSLDVNADRAVYDAGEAAYNFVSTGNGSDYVLPIGGLDTTLFFKGRSVSTFRIRFLKNGPSWFSHFTPTQFRNVNPVGVFSFYSGTARLGITMTSNRINGYLEDNLINNTYSSWVDGGNLRIGSWGANNGFAGWFEKMYFYDYLLDIDTIHKIVKSL